MNCRDIESLMLAERDGVLSIERHAALESHEAACPACRQFRRDVATALARYKDDVANVTVPNVDREWRAVQARLDGAAQPMRKRPLAPIIWLGTSLAAAAALVVAYVNLQPEPSPVPGKLPEAAQVAEADYVEAGDTNASTMVYVDKDSGWLVVWASTGDAKNSG